ncbi:NAD(P)H nitroreductase [Nocardia farcinica]|uniref:NAD(P)H nitroreductase n=1 Tax=Nocardia farcinica TaxID=37329 RepID=UPI001893422E|nr:NAD(P)H nitroreductase [Nocardia farcinica]MBF6234893.1 NAD(P)H nitroreductase [Nocardia farcinica]MBF6445333.1 NAD(P)H nitroreductase [Nocardia farcinica]
MLFGTPDDDTIRSALALAGRAPAVSGIQRWRWRIANRQIDLYADPPFGTDVTRSELRDILLDCGVALHHVTIALTAAGWAPVVRRLPDPDAPDHLAAVRMVAHRATPQDLALAAAAATRESDSGPFADGVMPRGCMSLLAERAAACGAVVQLASDEQRRVIFSTSFAKVVSGSGGIDGCEVGAKDETSGRGQVLVIHTVEDDRVARIRAGEALSAVLLTATNVGLATCPLGGLSGGDLRSEIDRLDPAGALYPQALLRIGWSVCAPDTTLPGEQELPR